ncbi:MAG: PLDc N-terminal domain-containing protein, partial [Oscillospiraceae bacterium]
MFSLLFVIAIVGDDSNPTFKVAWIIPILVFPFFGWLLYGVFGRRKVTTKAKERYLRIFITSKRLIPQDSAAMDEIKEQDESIFRECCYINKTAHANVFVNTQTEFFPSGEAFFEVYKQELAKAKKFIFLE